MIDISSNNHLEGEPIDWSAVRESGIRAVMIKATEGIRYVNPYLRADYDGARKVGLDVGFYHFARPVQNTPQPELGHFVETVKGLSHQCGMALDFEALNGHSPTSFRDWVSDFLHGLRQHTDWPVLYCDRSVHSALGGEPYGAFLWLASPGTHPDHMPWAWQAGIVTVPGISGPVDHDLLYATPGRPWPER